MTVATCNTPTAFRANDITPTPQMHTIIPSHVKTTRTTTGHPIPCHPERNTRLLSSRAKPRDLATKWRGNTNTFTATRDKPETNCYADEIARKTRDGLSRQKSSPITDDTKSAPRSSLLEMTRGDMHTENRENGHRYLGRTRNDFASLTRRHGGHGMGYLPINNLRPLKRYEEPTGLFVAQTVNSDGMWTGNPTARRRCFAACPWEADRPRGSGRACPS